MAHPPAGDLQPDLLKVHLCRNTCRHVEAGPPAGALRIVSKTQNNKCRLFSTFTALNMEHRGKYWQEMPTGEFGVCIMVADEVLG